MVRRGGLLYVALFFVAFLSVSLVSSGCFGMEDGQRCFGGGTRSLAGRGGDIRLDRREEAWSVDFY